MTGAQMDLFEARRAKERGLDAVQRHNSRWIDYARPVARRIARERGTVTADDVREALEPMGIRPDHPNAYGGLFRHGFEWTGEWRISRRVIGHGNQQRVWRSKVVA
jgi:hypothetical protein